MQDVSPVPGNTSLLDIRMADGESGPVIKLSGEADLTTVEGLNDVLNSQIRTGVPVLTLDLAELRFADSATIAALVRAARAMSDQGGRLELIRPQPTVARVLTLMGVDQVITVRDEASVPVE